MSLLAERSLLLLRLVLADLWHDRKISLCVAASLMAVIAPLLLLFGLKHGVVSQLQADLLSDPRNLEIRMLSSGSYSPEWIDQLRSQPGTGFVAGLPRSLNTQADLLGAQRRFVENAEIIPTASGDPLTAGIDVQLATNQVILSARAADQLQLDAGQSLRLRVMRRVEGQQQQAEVSLHIVAVLPPARFARAAAFVPGELLLALEHYRDGHAVPLLGNSGGRDAGSVPVRYARARLYAADIDSVAALERWLQQQRIETSSRLADIENVKAINHVLEVIFAVIAGASLTGCLASLAGAFFANIDRKRRSLALLRLLGFGRTALAAYLLLQGMLLALFGFAGGLLGYLAGSQLFNRLLGHARPTGEFVCQITPQHALLALLLAMGLATLVALFGALRAIHIEPAESLREL